MMNRHILIPTIAEDIHGFLVAHTLRRKGGYPILWYTPDFPTKTHESVHAHKSCFEIAILNSTGEQLRTDVDCLWNRRIRDGIRSAPLDVADRPFAEVQCSRFRDALLSILSEQMEAKGCLCINPWKNAIRAENKLVQHYAASQVGLDMPESIYSNSPSEIRRFIRRQGGTIVYKPFRGALWKSGDAELGYFTNAIGESDLVEDYLIQAVPGIYQELVPKLYELRVVMMGEHAFCAKINSQQTSGGKQDWRRAYDELTMEPAEISGELRQQFVSFMRRLGLVFGCIDVIVTPDGRHVFLEINQAGQFLFIEEYSGIPLLDAFSEFLLQGRTDFVWKDCSSTVHLADLSEEIKNGVWDEYRRHVHVPQPVLDEDRVAT